MGVEEQILLQQILDQLQSTSPATSVNVTDRAARLLGITYGSQGQQLQQRAATFELLIQLMNAGVEIDPRQIRALTSADVVDVSDRAARLLGVVYGSQGQQLQQDPVTGNLATITNSQEAGHAGIKYISSDVVTGLGSGATKKYLIIAPDTAIRIHLIYSVEATPGVTITVYEAPTKTANGTVLAINNRNRNSANTATAAVYKDPTITANGTLLRINEVGSGAAGGKVGGITASDRDEREWILKQNTAYLLNIVTLAANTDIATAIQWYEV